MQMTPEARLWLDATVQRILARHPLGDAERTGITYELMSHLHAAGEAQAARAGRHLVEKSDLETALLQAGGDAALAAAFVQPMAKPLVRVLFWRRAGAFALDAFLLLIILTFLHGAIAYVYEHLLAGLDLAPARHQPGGGVWSFMPWGFHDATLPAIVQTLLVVASAATVLGYFAWFESRDGRTLGKRAFDLRVLHVDGSRLTRRAALVRNLTKISPPLLLLDVIIMFFAYAEGKQRASDRLAKTIVVRA